MEFRIYANIFHLGANVILNQLTILFSDKKAIWMRSASFSWEGAGKPNVIKKYGNNTPIL